MKADCNLHIPVMKLNIFWDYILIYLLLLFSAGFFFRHQYNRLTIPLYLILLLFTIIKRGVKLKGDILVPTIVLIMLIMVTAFFTSFGDYKRYVFYIISTIIAYLITQIFSYRKIYRIFSNLLYYICIASIVGWFLVEFTPSVLELLFPKLTNTVGYDAYYLVLTMLNVPSYMGFENRAMGIFWEPGAFQTMIVIALIGDMFVNNNVKIHRRYIVFFLALVLTKSTTGYLCLFMLTAIVLVKENKISVFQIILFFLAIVTVFILFEFKDRLPRFLYFTIFEKIEALLDYRPGAKIGDVPAMKTAYVRMDSIYYPFIEFLKSPIWGIGLSGYDRISDMIGYRNMATFTPINYFAYFGIFYAYVSIHGFWRTIKRIDTNRLNKILIVLLIIIAVASEDFCGGTACITIFILYGYDRRIAFKSY